MAKLTRKHKRDAENDSAENNLPSTEAEQEHHPEKIRRAANSDDIDQLKSFLIKRLAEDIPVTKLIGLEAQEKTLRNLVTKTLETGENNSALLIGPRGTGKTALLNKVLEEVKTERECSSDSDRKEPFLLIKLNGLVHTKDKEALDHIISVLSLDEEIDLDQYSSFAEAFLKVFQVLKQSQRNTPIIIVLDEFELFASHPKQALLYSLFDTVQASKISLLVLGISTRQDALDLLEKRVKSRFSHRIVFFDPVKSLDMFDAVSRNYFDLSDTGHKLLTGISSEHVHNFTQKMEEIYETSCYKRIIKDICDYQGSIRQIATFWINVLSHLNTKSQFVEVKWLEEEFMALSLDSKIPQLQDLPCLELGLLIAAKKLSENDLDMFNFEMVYEQYKQFANVHGLPCNSYSAYKSFENLFNAMFLKKVESVSKCPKEFRMYRILVNPHQVKEASIKSNKIPFSLKKWGST